MAELNAAQRHVLQHCSLFEQLTADVCAAIIHAGVLRQLSHGQLLFARGAQADGWYAVLSGAIRVGAVTESGREIILAYLEPGTFFGEISLFDAQPRSHDNHAHGECQLLFVPTAGFRSLLQAHPSLRDVLMLQLCQRMRLLFAAVEDASLLNLDVRLARQLLSLLRSYGQVSADGASTRINLRLQQESLAQLLGVSRQRINQELRKLERLNIIEQKAGYLSVIDRQALGTPGKWIAPVAIESTKDFGFKPRQNAQLRQPSGGSAEIRRLGWS